MVSRQPLLARPLAPDYGRSNTCAASSAIFGSSDRGSKLTPVCLLASNAPSKRYNLVRLFRLASPWLACLTISSVTPSCVIDHSPCGLGQLT